MMQTIDWVIVFGFLAVLVAVAVSTKRYTRSVADYLAANRCAGRYLITAADIMVSFGVASVISFFEIYYKAGFTAQWWQLGLAPVVLAVYISGWVIYRFRRTRSLTLLQFFEQRYSKRFRIFMGCLSFVVFMVTMGIIPAAEARFIVYCCGLPETFSVVGATLPTMPVVMVSLISVALAFALFGGHIAVMVTDFLQSMFCNVVFLILLITMVLMFDWGTIIEGLGQAPEQASMIHPFRTSETKHYDWFFFMVMAFNFFFVYPAWQGPQAYHSAARTPHEARMARILGQIRGVVLYSTIVVLPVIAFVVMHHPQFAETAASVTAQLANAESDYVRNQMTVPTVLGRIIPTGLFGAFIAAMIAAMISTNDTLLHAWGSIFVQDVLLPFRTKPFGRRTHMLLLRLATVGVAIFLAIFSLTYNQTQDIMLFWALMGSFYYGGGGAALVFGLYWKRGTTEAAWAGALTSIGLTTLALAGQRLYPDTFDAYKLDGQRLSLYIALTAIFVYILVSLVQWLVKKRPAFAMERLLHQGRYAMDDEDAAGSEERSPWREWGITPDFTPRDKLVFWLIIANTGISVAAFLVITAISLFHDLGNGFWAVLWQIFIWQTIIVGTAVTIWFLIGGAMDFKALIKRLATVKRDDLDDGMVVGDHNLDEEREPLT